MPRDDLAFFRHDIEDELASSSGRSGIRRPALETLAAFALEDAVPSALRRRLARSGSFALVIEVPSGDWVEPVAKASAELASWTYSFARSGSARTEDRPERGNDKVAETLARGGRVVGVSQAPERLLPATLVSVADVRIRIGQPSNAVVARVIRSATGGRLGPMPPRIAAGLTYWELCAAVRGSPGTIVDRLAALGNAKSEADPGVAGAPAFGDLVGYGAAHDWGLRFLDDLEAWRRDEIPFDRIDRAVVFGSEPGLGKSSYVRALARAARLPLSVSSVSTWFTQSSGYLDGVLRQIDGVFENAASRSPSILFLDEIDSIPDRNTLDSRAREWWNTVVTHILLTIDRVMSEPSINLCIVGATNYADRLDAALVRPGRLNRVIFIGPPSAADLSVIARQHLGDDLAGLDLAVFGEIAFGATGAQVAGWVKDARTAARAAGRPLLLDDLLQAAAPPDTRPHGVRWRCALHEAGHAVSVEILGTGHIKQVDIVARASNGGATAIVPNETSMPLKDDLERLVVSLLCGRAAELVFLREACGGSGGARDSDLARATALVAGVHGSFGLGGSLAYLGTMDDFARGLRNDGAARAAVETDLARLQGEAVKLIEHHAVSVRTVAERLIAHRVVSGDTLRAILAGSDAAGECRP
ncbi:AAA family ATPase [Methylobacterium haplocladii]|uniref:AAA+ ATPase domain-containing protein n=1 Tax=Methylobacterium haplocladii TaxID=1176176 RepID=A0A512IJI8_9HYPH|nr:AAA family ATPase [Methylobacterium haplocladii]GEO97873.1 hypothetical protein MHA02_02610 [Methylobacterium haplocladii]GJD82717.1 ATP-dependent zinc metalloprotease FtsH [Methylobacterium haplocladii]GLS57495.1 hypothetical protein GCM10007887_01500 [Methylobacterium haplocladii]